MTRPDLFERTWQTYIPGWLWAIIAICVLPGVVLSGFLLFDAMFMAVGGFDNIAARSIWSIDVMVSHAYSLHAGTFFAVIALLLGAAAVLDMSFDSDESKKSSPASGGFGIADISAGIVVIPAAIIGGLAILLSFAFVIMMAFPLMFVMVAFPVHLLVLLVVLAISIFAFVSAALPFNRV